MGVPHRGHVFQEHGAAGEVPPHHDLFHLLQAFQRPHQAERGGPRFALHAAHLQSHVAPPQYGHDALDGDVIGQEPVPVRLHQDLPLPSAAQLHVGHARRAQQPVLHLFLQDAPDVLGPEPVAGDRADVHGCIGLLEMGDDRLLDLRRQAGKGPFHALVCLGRGGAHVRSRLKDQGHHAPVLLGAGQQVPQPGHVAQGLLQGTDNEGLHVRRRHAAPHVHRDRDDLRRRVGHKFHGQLTEGQSARRGQARGQHQDQGRSAHGPGRRPAGREQDEKAEKQDGEGCFFRHRKIFLNLLSHRV